MNKIVLFLSLLLCCPLAACHQHTAEGITYIIEEGPPTQVRGRYYPLLDIIKRFEDFYEDEARTLDASCDALKDNMRVFIYEREKEILELLLNTVTIDDYLFELITMQEGMLSASVSIVSRYLLGMEIPQYGTILPTSKKIHDFLMKDKGTFGGHEEGCEHSRLRTIKEFGLLNELIQAAIALADRNALNKVTTDLLNESQSIIDCVYPDAIGNQYALLEQLIFGNDLTNKQNKHRIELKRLLKFDQIREQHPGNLQFVSELFRALYNTTDPAVTLHFLQLIKDNPIKIWFLSNVEKPDGMQYSTDALGTVKITSPLQPTIEQLTQASKKPATIQYIWSKDKWLAYIEGSTNKAITKKNKPQHTSLIKGASHPQRKKKTTPKPTTTSLQELQAISPTKLQEKHTKKQAQKTKKAAPNTSSIHDSLEVSTMPIIPAIPLQPILTTTGTALSLLPIIEEEEDTDISPTPTTQPTSNNTSLTLSTIEEEPMMDHLTPTKQSLPLSPPSTPNKSAKKKALIKFIITEKPTRTTAQEASPSKDKVLQEAEEKAQQKEPGKKIVSVASPENRSPISQPIFPQNTIQTTPQRFFTMPQGLRSFHAEQLQAAHPIIPFPKHQAAINQLFDPATQCNTTYKIFKTLWIANGGDIKQKGGSHCTLQFPQGTNLFGIYKPHGSSATYGKQAIRYLQAATLYIGLRPTNWS
jgi:hypothetical protein